MDGTTVVLLAEGITLIGLLVGWSVRVSRTHTAVMTRFTVIERTLGELSRSQDRHASEMAAHAKASRDDREAIADIRERLVGIETCLKITRGKSN